MDKKYNHTHAEQELQTQWLSEQLYAAPTTQHNIYSIDTPPPTVSGSLHIGHIFSYTQTDIIARYKRLSGYQVFYPFGFDDNGLPTEKYIEKKCQVRAHELGRSAFIDLCLRETQQAEDEFKTLWQKMGLSVDWQYTYTTISAETRRLSQLSFIQLLKKGFIYRKKEPALYCTSCRTTVAQAELDDAVIASSFNDIAFKDMQGNDLIISTTRPELLPSVVALLYHPNDSRYQQLQGNNAYVPLYNRTIPILADELVDPEKGTGLVMVCTFGDQHDIEWYKKHNLPLRIAIGLDGKWTEDTGPLAGLKVQDARKKIIELLEQEGSLRTIKPIEHTVNVHERCKKEIEYMVFWQWFVAILPYKKQFIEIAHQINWYPSFMKSRYINWVENIKWDWCISRQRFYGIPFPVWHCTTCNDVIIASPDQLPIDPQETSAPNCSSCGTNQAVVPDTDVMDTWNTSSITPYICSNLLHPSQDPFIKNDDFIPMGMRPQAHDIIRTWAFDTIVKIWMHQGIYPWKDIVISGHVLSSAKEKLSKSKGNNPLDPHRLLETYSADVIRFWTASGSLGHDIQFSETPLKIGQRLVTKLWNAFIFIEPHISIIQDPDTIPDVLGDAQEWILDATSRAFIGYQSYFERNEFGLALQSIDSLFWQDFCDNYIELIKHQLFNPHEYSPQEVYATQWTLYHVGLRILQLYSPYLSHVTDIIYRQLYTSHGPKSIHATTFDRVQTKQEYPLAHATMSLIITIIGIARKLKTTQQLSLKTPFEQLTLELSPEHVDSIKKQEQLIKGVIHAQTIVYVSATPIDRTGIMQKDQAWHAIITIVS